MSAVDTADPDAVRGEPDLRCSPWTQAQGVDPIGSAGSFDQLLLVEWPLPWPADVSEVPALADTAADPRARADDGRAPSGRRGGGRAGARRPPPAGGHPPVRPASTTACPADAVPSLLAALLEQPERDQRDWPSVVGDAPPEVLVCGHGRRDPCCGRWGTLLHVELAARATDVRVWRCSHTGGHRFAPTAITPPRRSRVGLRRCRPHRGGHRPHRRRREPGGARPRLRGPRPVGPGRRARPVRALRLGVARRRAHRQPRTEVAEDGQSARVQLEWRDGDGTAGRADADVVVTRTLPVLVCGEPPERATKSSPELALRRLDVSS